MPIRIATFNVENLLRRFDFHRYGRLVKERTLSILGVGDDAEGMTLRRALHVGLTEDMRQMTGQAIRDTGADIICLQEVDNLQVLEDFDSYYVDRPTGIRYGWERLIEGNDRRGIDVAVMSKQRIGVTSHQELTFDDLGLFNQELEDYGLRPGHRVFRRDCLEITTKVDGEDLTIFNCHFKSMSGGRDETMPVREAEAKAVVEILKAKYGGLDAAKAAKWVICGDLNDYTHSSSNGQELAKSGLRPLFNHDLCFNPVLNLPFSERWTHYYPKDDAKRQLDYVLLSPALRALNADVEPQIVRGGMPYRVPGLDDVKRYPRMGFDRPKASDHCPLTVELTIAG